MHDFDSTPCQGGVFVSARTNNHRATLDILRVQTARMDAHGVLREIRWTYHHSRSGNGTDNIILQLTCESLSNSSKAHKARWTWVCVKGIVRSARQPLWKP